MPMGPFEKHVFICTSGSVCPVETDAVGIHARLKELVHQAGLASRIRINKAGCFDQCGHGPLVAVYPENVWYSRVTVAAAEAIFNQHLVGGTPIKHMIYNPAKPGGNKIARP